MAYAAADGTTSGRLPQERHEQLGREQEQRSGDAEQDGDENAALDPARDGGRRPGADRLGDDGVQHHQRPHAEHAEPEEVEVAERHGGERYGGDMPHHDGVHHAHQHHPDLDEDDGGGKPHHGTQVLPPGQQPTGGWRRAHAHSRLPGKAEVRGGRAAARAAVPRSRDAPPGLGDFGAQGESTSCASTSVACLALARFRVPPAQTPTVHVAKVPGDDDDQVVEPPDAEPAEGGAHEDAACVLPT